MRQSINRFSNERVPTQLEKMGWWGEVGSDAFWSNKPLSLLLSLLTPLLCVCVYKQSACLNMYIIYIAMIRSSVIGFWFTKPQDDNHGPQDLKSYKPTWYCASDWLLSVLRIDLACVAQSCPITSARSWVRPAATKCSSRTPGRTVPWAAYTHTYQYSLSFTDNCLLPKSEASEV